MNLQRFGLLGLCCAVVFLASSRGYATECLDQDGNEISVNNQQIIEWKSSTANSFRSRGHIEGTILRHFPDQSGHHHIEVNIGGGQAIEVIYNEDFGAIPTYHVGSQVEACGDYITAFAQAGPYPPSPDGAILHWVHNSPNLRKHPSGFLIIDGQICGEDAEHAGPKRPRHGRD